MGTITQTATLSAHLWGTYASAAPAARRAALYGPAASATAAAALSATTTVALAVESAATSAASGRPLAVHQFDLFAADVAAAADLWSAVADRCGQPDAAWLAPAQAQAVAAAGTAREEVAAQQRLSAWVTALLEDAYRPHTELGADLAAAAAAAYDLASASACVSHLWARGIAEQAGRGRGFPSPQAATVRRVKVPTPAGRQRPRLSAAR